MSPSSWAFSGRHALARALLVAVLVWMTSGALAGQEDDWLGSDKALHFAASAAIAAGSYGAASLVLECRPGRIAVGAATALAAGVGKELYDRSTDGVASWKDLAWDVLGTVAGVTLASWVDGTDPCPPGQVEMRSGATVPSLALPEAGFNSPASLSAPESPPRSVSESTELSIPLVRNWFPAFERF